MHALRIVSAYLQLVECCVSSCSNLTLGSLCLEAYHKGPGEWPRLRGLVADACKVNVDASFLLDLSRDRHLECLPYLDETCMTGSVSESMVIDMMRVAAVSMYT